MNTIRFGSGKAYHITSNKLHDGLLSQLEKRWSIQPFTTPFKYDAERITKINIKSLRKTEYLIRISTIGTKYILYFTVYNSKKYIILISPRHEKLYMLKNNFNSDDDTTKSLFTDTIIKTELTKSNKDDKWYLLATDIIAKYGDDMRKVNYADRLSKLFKLEKLLKNKITDANYETVLVTDCQSLQHLVTKTLPISKFTVPNIIFQPKYAKYGMKPLIYNIKDTDKPEQSALSKFMVPEQQTDTPKKPIRAVFEMNMTNRSDVYQLYYYNDDNELVNYGLAYISDEKHSQTVLNIYKKVKPISIKGHPDLFEMKTTMLCEYTEKFDKWKPLKQTNKSVSTTKDLAKVANTTKT